MFFYTKYMNVPERDLDLPDLLFDLAVAFEDSLSTSDTVADEPLSGETRPTIQCLVIVHFWQVIVIPLPFVVYR